MEQKISGWYWLRRKENQAQFPNAVRMNSGGARGGVRGDLAVPPQYEDEHWPLYTQERRGSIPMGILRFEFQLLNKRI